MTEPMDVTSVAGLIRRTLLDSTPEAAAVDDVVDSLRVVKTASDNTPQIIDGVFNGWNRTNSVDHPASAVAETMEAIRLAASGAYIWRSYTSSGTFTVTSAMRGLIVILVSAGQDGETGAGYRSTTRGGLGGSYLAVTLNLAAILGGAPEVSVPISVGVSNGAPSSFGGFVSLQPGAAGGIYADSGYLPTGSSAGRGGNGGQGGGYEISPPGTGRPGTSSTVAAGGSAGATAGAGGNGGAASTAALVKCGGAGGGGGGGGTSSLFGGGPGGRGGNGGFPGGGGGGGGGGGEGSNSKGANGAGGTGAAGCVWVLYK